MTPTSTQNPPFYGQTSCHTISMLPNHQAYYTAFPVIGNTNWGGVYYGTNPGPPPAVHYDAAFVSGRANLPEVMQTHWVGQPSGKQYEPEHRYHGPRAQPEHTFHSPGFCSRQCDRELNGPTVGFTRSPYPQPFLPPYLAPPFPVQLLWYHPDAILHTRSKAGPMNPRRA